MLGLAEKTSACFISHCIHLCLLNRRKGCIVVVINGFSGVYYDFLQINSIFRLVAIALLYLEQEDAFWCLVTIVEVFMPRDYYTKTLLGSQVCALPK